MPSERSGPTYNPVAPSGGDATLGLALVLALPTIALEQFLHTDRWTLAALPLYQALHWLSDSLLALPLGRGRGLDRPADRHPAWPW